MLPVSFSLLIYYLGVKESGGKGGRLFVAVEGLTWVGGDEGAVEAEDRVVWVDEDGFLFAGAGIEETEEWAEARFAEVETLVIGQEDSAGGS